MEIGDGSIGPVKVNRSLRGKVALTLAAWEGSGSIPEPRILGIVLQRYYPGIQFEGLRHAGRTGLTLLCRHSLITNPSVSVSPLLSGIGLSDPLT